MNKIKYLKTLIILILLTINISGIVRSDQVKTIDNCYDYKANDEILKIFRFIDNMQAGDIIVHMPGKEGQYGHCRIFTGCDYSKNKYLFVDSYFHVLGYGRNKFRVATLFLFLTYFWGYDGLVLVRVNATEKQKQNAIDFANLQVGKRFDFCKEGVDKIYNPEDSRFKSANLWYCSELPWAAYYNCNNSFPIKEPEEGYIYGEGIDIDANGWEKDHETKVGIIHSLVYPMDIINDDDVQIIDIWMRNN